jgi:hypothetical protein
MVITEEGPESLVAHYLFVPCSPMAVNSIPAISTKDMAALWTHPASYHWCLLRTTMAF